MMRASSECLPRPKLFMKARRLESSSRTLKVRLRMMRVRKGQALKTRKRKKMRINRMMKTYAEASSSMSRLLSSAC